MSEPVTKPTDPRTRRAPNLGHRTYYFNRELSWLEFNRRVAEEALDEHNPLLERVKFIAIFCSNLDEFFMVRISGLRRHLSAGAVEPPIDGMTPSEQLEAVRTRLLPMLDELNACWRNQLVPALEGEGVRILRWDDLKSLERKELREQFKNEISPALTPLAFDPGHPFPHISNLSINLAVAIEDPTVGTRFARVKVPQLFNRLLPIAATGKSAARQRLGLGASDPVDFVWLEEVITANLDLLFPGMEITGVHPFRVTRDADFEIEEDEAADLMEAMQEVVDQRHFGSAVRLEVGTQMPRRIREILMRNLELAPFQVYETDGPLGSSDLMQLASLDRPELKDSPFAPVPSKALNEDESLFAVLRERDVLLYHPFDSFNPVLELIRQAARDPKVVAIKMTLYRVGPDSPIVAALREARENGIQVSALIELKARFDEANNIEWAQSLEDAGVHVVYGLMGLKVHTKMALIVRRETDGMRRYVHLGTGNYNPVTAKIYTDLAFLSSNPDLGADVSDLFHSLTGYSAKTDYAAQGARRRPSDLQDELSGRQGLHQEALQGLPGRRASRSPGPRHLLPQARSRPRQREHHRHLDRRPVPRACARLLLPQRGRRGDPDGQRRPDAAQPQRPRRVAVPGGGSEAQAGDPRRHPPGAVEGQRSLASAAAGWQLRAAPARRRREVDRYSGASTGTARLLASRRVGSGAGPADRSDR